MVDLKRIDFSPETGGPQYFPLDKNKPQDIEDMTPHANCDLVICLTRYPAADGLRRCVLGFRILQVRYWHKTDMSAHPLNVRYRG